MKFVEITQRCFQIFRNRRSGKGSKPTTKGREPRMQDTRTELKAAGLDPLSHLHIWLFVGLFCSAGEFPTIL